MSLIMIIGPMFAGKTNELIKRINTSTSRKLIINNILDTRYSNSNIASHDGKLYPCINLEKLKHIYPIIKNNDYDEIYIDEVQFFDDLYEVVWDLVVNKFKHVIISGLDGDYQIHPFNKSHMLDLIPLANEILKLHSKCYKCNKNAWFTKKISQLKCSEQILIGNDNIYQPTCLEHHLGI